MEVRRLLSKDMISDFSCGTSALDDYLSKHARESAGRQWNATWLAIDTEGDDAIAGYVTMVPGSVRSALLKPLIPRLPGYPAPVLLLAKMATDLRFRGRGVGTRLLREVFRAALTQAEQVGCVGVFTDAKPDAVAFYDRQGFVLVEAPQAEVGTTAMFLTMPAVRERLVALADAPQ